MIFLDQSQKHLLVSNNERTYLLQKPHLKLIGQYDSYFKMGCLQYSTGIAALGKGSIISIYDFKSGKMRESIETYLNLVKVAIVKNILIGVSDERILIHDLQTNQALCHIPIHKGKTVAIHKNYYQLKMLYPIQSHLFEEQDIWANKISRYQFHDAESVHYDQSGKISCFINKNVASLYENDDIVKGCSFNSTIIDVRKSCKTDRVGSFYYMTEGGGKDNQPMFMEFSLVSKNYLKFAQNILEGEQKQSHINGPEIGMMFNYDGGVYLWKNDQIFKGQDDLQPQFYMQQTFKNFWDTKNGEQFQQKESKQQESVQKQQKNEFSSDQ